MRSSGFNRFHVRALGAVVAVMLLAGAPLRAAAQAPPVPAEAAGGEAVTVSDLEDLARTIEDDAARARFLKELRAAIEARKRAAPPAPAPEAVDSLGARLIFTISAGIRDASTKVLAAAEVLRDLPALVSWIERQVGEPEARRFWLELFVALALVLALGFFAEWVAYRLLAAPRRRLEETQTESMLRRAWLLFLRTVLDLIPLAVFAVATYGTLSLVAPRETTRLVALALINANVLARAVRTVARLLIVPRAPALRLLRLADESAHYAFIWVRRLTNVAVYGYFTVEAALLLGLPPTGHAVALKALGLIVAAMLIILILQNRAPVAAWIGPGGTRGAFDGLRGRLAEVWHVLAAIYVGAIYGVWVLEISGGFEFLLSATVLTAVILIAARLTVTGLTRALDRGFRISEEVTAKYPGLEGRANRYLPALHRVLRAVVYVIAAVFLLQAWGVESFDWLTSDAGLRAAGTVLSIALILLAALVFWEAFSLMVERYLAKLDGEGGGSARTRTLLPLARNAVLVVLVVLVGMIVVSELGVNIGPLLAGAGVVGLAIGIGAQKLVQDVITGLFILIEDTIAVGDVVNLGANAGLVEALTIRTIRLRDLAGVVHTVPFSEVRSILNMTKDFSRYVFEVGVAYRENVDEVIEVLQQIGAGMQEDETYGPLILEPLEVLGLDKFADSAIVIKARITTQPIKQWTVGREFNRRMKKRFDELGIEIPFPHMTLYFGEDKEGVAPPAYVKLAEAAEKAPARKRGRPEAARSAARGSELPDAAAAEAPGGAAGGDGDDA